MAKQRRSKWYDNIVQVQAHFFGEEVRRGTLSATIVKSLKSGRLEFAENLSPSDLLEERAQKQPNKTFLIFEGENLTFKEVNKSVNRYARLLEELGAAAGSGIGIMMHNTPEFLYVFFASQKIGAYAVPINSSLVGEGLQHVIDHSDAEFLVADEEFKSVLKDVTPSTKLKRTLFRKEIIKLAEDQSTIKKRGWSSDPKAISLIMYTSGTTGLPKGVVARYETGLMRKLGLIAHLIYKKDDVLYTCLPLFHANALFITLSAALWQGLSLVLVKKFSASRFWNEIRTNQVTVFNVIGAMIPILMKQPKKAQDKNNVVRLVLSAGCPVAHWRAFEERFGTQIWESYSAIDGGQRFTFNMGNAPVGSIGKSFAKYRIVDDNCVDVKAGAEGELIFPAPKGEKPVEYYKDEKATKEKVKDGHIHTGDVVYEDAKGYLYFVGRKSESMRRRGENVSEFEVEKIILQNPDVLECAVYAVPSDLGEDEIMCSLVPVEGHELAPEKLHSWLNGKLAKFAIPRFIRVAEELPKTPTHRVLKKQLVVLGVTSDTWDGFEGGEAKKETEPQEVENPIDAKVLGSDILTPVEKTIFRRRSTRMYKKDQVPPALLRRVLEAARFAPSAGNCQPWRFIVINDREMIDAIEDSIKDYMNPIKHAGDGPGLKRDLLVSAVGLLRSKNVGDIRPLGAAKEVVENRLRVFHNAPCLILVLKDTRGIGSPDLDNGMCGQNLCLTAHSLGLGTCYIGFATLLQKCSSWLEELDIESPWEVVTGITIGYPKFNSEGVVQRDQPQIDWYEKRGDKEVLY